MTASLVCELRRLLRSPRFLIFTAGLPLVYFLLFSGIYAPDGGETVVVLMAMMAAFGAISASISVGGRVANERHIGWNRQLRLTPLPGWGYLAVKAAAAMLVVLPALLLVFGVAAVVKGVDLGVGTWLAVLLTAWLSVLPFAAVGLLIGMAATPRHRPEHVHRRDAAVLDPRRRAHPRAGAARRARVGRAVPAELLDRRRDAGPGVGGRLRCRGRARAARLAGRRRRPRDRPVPP